MSEDANIFKKFFGLKLLSREGAFTLVELLIVMFIMGLLSVIAIANYKDGKKQYQLNLDAQKLISQIRKAQNMSMSGSNVESGYCGYGINLDQSNPESYIIFKETHANCSNFLYNSSQDEVVETLKLSEVVKIESLSKDGSSKNSLDIFFEPPDPKTYINNDNTNSLGTVVLKIKGEAQTKTITINEEGSIESN